MANQSEPDSEQVNKESRYMWIAVGVIVAVLVGGMGVNMLVHHDTNASTIETTNPQQ
jgi:hypothetical protein